MSDESSEGSVPSVPVALSGSATTCDGNRARHTPGPWTQWNTHGRKATTTVKSADRTTICTIADGTDEWVNAHARLIAAAPEMLEALRGIISEPVEHNGGWVRIDFPVDVYDDARAALAKATKGTP